MSESKEQNIYTDRFSQYMQHRLRKHQLPPDAACWDEIERRLQGKSKSLFVRRSLYVAAAVIALLLLVNILRDKEIALPETAEIIIERTEVEAKTQTDVKTITYAETETEVNVKIKTDAEIRAKANEKVIAEVEIEVGTETEIETEAKAEIISENEPEKPEKTPQTTNNKKDFYPPAQDREPLMPSLQGKKKGNWLASATFGTGRSNSFLNAERFAPPNAESSFPTNDLSNGAIIPTPPDYYGALQPEDYNDISYNIPLSFGMTVRKKLSRNIAVETGLIYTYLSTNFTGSGGAMVDGKLGLHYLGIPANLIIGLWSDRSWDVYVSGGVMAEKGLRSIYTQHRYMTGRTETVTIKTSVSGMQWSLNSSLGFSYRLYKEWSIYAEPRISYFFDNYQPISIRTEQPVTFGIGAGIRYEF